MDRTSAPFNFDGDTLRVRGLADDSGVRGTRKAGMRKWVLERRLPGGRWDRDCHTFLANSATVADAKTKLGF